MDINTIITLIIGVVLLVIAIMILKNTSNAEKNAGSAVNSSIEMMSRMLTESQEKSAKLQDQRLEALSTNINKLGEDNNKQLNQIRETVNTSLDSVSKVLLENQKNSISMQKESQEKSAQIQEERLRDIKLQMEKMTEDNNKQLNQMRDTVDEKLQKTLEERISKSFQTVSERLEQVYKGLGEMQNLATGVGDLKKVLSNVKTRGILGEIQLGAILEEILSPEQYEENIQTRSSGNERVEFAIKMPGGEDDRPVYLPIDSKFPGDTYGALVDAYEAGDKDQIDIAFKILENTIKKSAKDISTKYIEPPYTTDFAIMFLPFEGLYSEVVRSGLVEILQRDYKINVAGPTTMAALLNSLQMGFKTLAIQKRSSEVWDILAKAKGEFEKFGNVLDKTQDRLRQANEELDKLVGTRTRSITRALKDVTASPETLDDTNNLINGE